MALEWEDLIDGKSEIVVDDINKLASAIKDNEKAIKNLPQADVSGKVDVVDENGNFFAGNVQNNDVTNVIWIGKETYGDYNDNIQIGNNSVSSSRGGIVIGHNANIGENAEGAIQIGEGTNNESGTVKIYDHLLMRKDGSLPYVDDVVGDINLALDELHQYALSLQGGSAE